jgi:glycosyltransferase involved in cell wall biosynthesis
LLIQDDTIAEPAARPAQSPVRRRSVTKLYYVSPFDVRRPGTNQIADVRLCEGFAHNGCDVTLIAPNLYQKGHLRIAEVFQNYGVEDRFRIHVMLLPFRRSMPDKFTFVFGVAYATLFVLAQLIRDPSRRGETVVMSRQPSMLWPLLWLRRILRIQGGPMVVAWTHELKRGRRFRWVYEQADCVVGTNSTITQDLAEEFGVDAARLAVSLNPINERQVQGVSTREEARRRLGLQLEGPLVVYTGKLFIGQHEAQLILEAARRMPDCTFLFTGGKPAVVEHYRAWCEREGLKRVMFTGYMYDYTRIIDFQQAADVLVSYYSRREHNVRYNLPNKLCEYMLTRNVIVTCDFPAGRDVLTRENAIFVEPENPEALAAGIRWAIDNPDASKRLAQRAFQDVSEMTFGKRTRMLLDFFESCR